MTLGPGGAAGAGRAPRDPRPAHGRPHQVRRQVHRVPPNPLCQTPFFSNSNAPFSPGSGTAHPPCLPIPKDPFFFRSCSAKPPFPPIPIPPFSRPRNQLNQLVLTRQAACRFALRRRLNPLWPVLLRWNMLVSLCAVHLPLFSFFFLLSVCPLFFSKHLLHAVWYTRRLWSYLSGTDAGVWPYVSGTDIGYGPTCPVLTPGTRCTTCSWSLCAWRSCRLKASPRRRRSAPTSSSTAWYALLSTRSCRYFSLRVEPHCSKSSIKV